jgi:hypothetical protein
MIELIGTDPEFFLETNSGEISSSIGVIPGTKKKPFYVDDKVKVHPDNIAIELAVPPASNEDLFVENIKNAIDSAKAFLSSKNDALRINTSLVSCRPPQKLLQNKKAMTFGCEPDYDAFLMEINYPPSPNSDLRSCGGHIHVGLEKHLRGEQFIRKAVLMMDLYLGVPSIILDTDTERRSLYGKASCFRPKPYGFEYRTLSNFWLAKEEYIRWVYQNTKLAVEAAVASEDINFDQVSDIVQIINKQDVASAKSLITLLNIKMP